MIDSPGSRKLSRSPTVETAGQVTVALLSATVTGPCSVAADPVLPDELLPDGWPGAALRNSYAQFATELVARRNEYELMEIR